MFLMRFDMRAPDFGAAPADLYAAALDMAAWGEANGCVAAVVSEHHASPDGYLPSPLVLASAMAARIDGAGTFRTFWSIVLPMAKPALITLTILSFQGSWNELGHFIIASQNENLYTLTRGVAGFARLVVV